MAKKDITEISLHKIRSYIDGKTEFVTEFEQQKLDRLYFAYDCLKNESMRNTMSRIQRRFGVSNSQAHRDIEDCKKLFNPTYKHDIEWIENFIIEDIKLQILVAKAENNHTAWANARKDLVRMYAIMAAKSTDIDPEMLGNNSYFVVLQNTNEMLKLNLDELYKIPESQKLEITENFILSEIDEIEAKKMMQE